MTPSLIGLFFIFARIGLVTFGGGLASIPFLYNAFVTSTGWMTAAQFSEVISLAQMTPGPIVINAATLLGFRYGGGLIGALVATGATAAAPLLVVGLLMWCLSHAKGRAKTVVDRVRGAMKPVILAMLITSLWSLARPLLHRPFFFVFTVLTALALWKSSFFRAYPQVLLFFFALVSLGGVVLGLRPFL